MKNKDMIDRLLNRWMMALMCSIVSIMVMAQNTASLGGSITDKNSQQPLSGVSIKLIPGNNGTTTDTNG